MEVKILSNLIHAWNQNFIKIRTSFYDYLSSKGKKGLSKGFLNGKLKKNLLEGSWFIENVISWVKVRKKGMTC